MPLKLETSKKLLWLVQICGFVLGDGHLSKDLKHIIFSGDKKDLEQINQECEKYLRKIGKIRKQKTDHITRKGRIKGIGHRLQISHSPFAHLLYSLGISKGNKTKVKFDFPKWVWLDKDILRNFCRGLLWSEIATPRLENGKIATVATINFHMTKYKHIDSHVKFLKSFRKALENFGIQTSEVKKLYKEGRYGFYIRNNQLNILKLFKEFPPVYASAKAKAFEKIIRKIEKSVKVEREKIKLYEKVIKLRKQTGWGSPRIAKELGIKDSIVIGWIYHNSKPRLLK